MLPDYLSNEMPVCTLLLYVELLGLRYATACAALKIDHAQPETNQITAYRGRGI